MTVSRKNGQHRTKAPEPEYGSVVELLQTALVGMYRLSGEEAEALVNEAYRCCLLAREAATDEEKWVIGATLKYAETRERMHRPPGGPDDAAAEIARHRDLTLTREALDTLPAENARQAIRLRVEKGKSYAEIAAVLGVTARYAERMVLIGVAKLAARRRQERTTE
jgi:DNA-directed RNA polymerase specialized sigma24 family protein